MRALLGRQLRHHTRLLLAAMAGLAGFQVIIIVVMNALTRAPQMQTLLSSMLPGPMRQLMFEQFGFASFASGVAFGFEHPFSLALSIALIVVLASVPAAEREMGLLDLLLARPVPRQRYLGAQLVMVVAATVVLPSMLLLGTVVGTTLVEATGEISWTAYIRSASAYTPLLLVIGSYTLLLATLAKRRGQAVAFSVGLTLSFYLYDFIAGVWDPLKPYHWASIFDYYDPVRAVSTSVIHQLIACAVESCLQPHNRAEVVIRQC